MKKNIEIKAAINDLAFCMQKAKKLSKNAPEVIYQKDIFFNCKTGRLKLRFLSEKHGVLIYYQRPDKFSPKISNYNYSESFEPSKLLEVLDNSLGITGEVNKKRYFYLIGRTRVHIDIVDNLGEFFELEVMLSKGESKEAGIEEANSLMKQFKIKDVDLLKESYFDMLKQT